MNTLQAIADERGGVDKVSEQDKADVAVAFQLAVVRTLVGKCKRALEQTASKRLVVAGGVSANVDLRTALDTLLRKMQGEVYYPRTEFCTDNGAMVAFAGCQRLMAGEKADMTFIARPRWPMSELPPVVHV